MKRASATVKNRLKLLDAMTGYAGFVGLSTKEDRELLRRGWVMKVGIGTYRINHRGRQVLKRWIGMTSIFEGMRG